VTIRDNDLGYRQLLAALLGLPDTGIFVGIRGDAGDSADGTPLAVVAAANEFGTRTIPERSFLRSTVDSKQEVYEDQIAEVLEEVVDGGGLPALAVGLNRIGLGAVADVQETMRQLDDPPNAESTIRAKGADNPLIRDGRLRQSIDYEIRTG